MLSCDICAIDIHKAIRTYSLFFLLVSMSADGNSKLVGLKSIPVVMKSFEQNLGIVVSTY